MTETLIRNIQQRIAEAGYPNIQDFAEHSGIRADTLTRWIQGKSRPSKKSLEKLATALECSVDDLIGQERETSSDTEKDRTIEKLKKVIELQDRVIEKLERIIGHR